MENVEFEEITDRKGLAVVCKTNGSQPIEGKDRIEFLKIEGWTSVVQKGMFSEGELVLVIRYDSLVPPMKCLEFLGESNKNSKGAYRIKSRRFTTSTGPVYSQVVVLSEKDLKSEGFDIPFVEGDDWTDRLGIVKYVAPQNDPGFVHMKKIADFPTHLLGKTDETNIQGMKRLLNDIGALPYSITLKCDGSSFTAFLDPLESNSLTVCSRNCILLEDEENAYWKLAKRCNLKGVLKELLNDDLPKRYALQGEMCGPKIQKNKLNLTEDRLFIFNVVDLDSRKRIPFDEQISLCRRFALDHVPMVEKGECFSRTLEELLAIAVALRYPGTKNSVEGLVLRPKIDIYSPSIHRSLSCKIMNPEYVL